MSSATSTATCTDCAAGLPFWHQSSWLPNGKYHMLYLYLFIHIQLILGQFETFILSDAKQQRSLRLLLCGELCEELLYFILEHTELKLQGMTNGTVSKYEFADKTCW